MPPGGPGMPPGPPYLPPPPRGGSNGLLIGLAIGAGVLVIAIAVVVVVIVNGRDDAGGSGTTAAGRSATPQAGGQVGNLRLKPSDYDDVASWSLWDRLNDRSGDSAPLTVSEVFDSTDSRSVEDSKKNLYTLQGTGRMDTDCTQAVWGDDLKSVLGGYGCNQVARAVYADSTKRIVGQVAIFNLRDVTSSNQFVKDLDPAAGKGFLNPLGGRPAPIDRFGTGYSAADAGAYGHYVVVSWVGYTDGSNGSSIEYDAIPPRTAVERAAKNFLFSRLSDAG